jgi:endonuclease YncB( thermonuclease family)
VAQKRVFGYARTSGAFSHRCWGLFAGSFPPGGLDSDFGVERSAPFEDRSGVSWRRKPKLKLVGTDTDRDRRGRTSFRGFNEQLRDERQEKARRRKAWLSSAGVLGGAALLGAVYGGGWITFPSGTAKASGVNGIRAHFSMCFVGGGYNCVVDGDTIWLEGVKIRIADIDAPETHDPRCSSEKQLGDRATLRLQELLNDGAVTLATVDRDSDRYGRKLRIVDVDGKSVGDVLVAEGLAREWDGARHPWC